MFGLTCKIAQENSNNYFFKKNSHVFQKGWGAGQGRGWGSILSLYNNVK